MSVERRITTYSQTAGTLNFTTPTVNTKFPPYDLVALDDYNFRIVLAIAGYKKENVTISLNKNVLSVKGKWEEEKVDNASYVLNGIAKRDFSLDFKLGEYLEVSSAKTENGMLTISIVKNIPEEQRPKVIEIE